MKYFSPQLLDGSVTEAKIADGAVVTAKLADAAVVQEKIKTLSASQSGTIAIQGKVTITLVPYNFFPDIEADVDPNITRDTEMLANFKATPAAMQDFPQFDLHSEDTGDTRDYSVAWRAIEG